MAFQLAGLKDRMALNTVMLLHQIIYVSAGNYRGRVFFFFNVNTVSPEDIIKSLFSGPEMLQLWVCGPVHEAGHQQA